LAFSGVPFIGPLVAGLLMLPVFLFNLLWICALATAGYLPCVMAIESCGAVQGARRLIELLRKRGGRFIAYQIISSSIIGPVLFFIVVLVGVALGIAGIACAGYAVAQGTSGAELGVGLAGLSATIIVLAFLSFLFVYGCACGVVLYRAARDAPV